MSSTSPGKLFSRYQIFVIVVLSFIHFTVILDFMVIAPLGAMLMKTLNITPSKFGWVVSAYAFSAGISGLLVAGFADRFDRKKLLLFFYTGFVLGTFLCGVATGFYFLLFARIITGIFGGVIASVSFAIMTDLFPLDVRSRVMGFVQMSFAVSQIAGIPLGIYLANNFGWHAPFLLIVALSSVAGIVIVKLMRPIAKHLEARTDKHPLHHLRSTIAQAHYRKAFLTTAMLSIGGFMLMPFSSAFLVDNVLISQEQLPLIFLFTGLATMITLPLIGKISDTIGKFRVFVAGTLVSCIMIFIYTNLSATPLWMVIAINIPLFAGIMSRMVPAMALMTAVPDLLDRGAFMSINSSLQQIAGGVASVFAGLVVVQENNGPLEHYDVLGYICVGLMLVCVVLMYQVNRHVESKTHVVAP